MGKVETLFQVTEIALGAVAVGWLAHNAFSRETRREIMERDQRTCQETGRREEDGWYLMGSHFDHTKNDSYNDPKRGEVLCVPAHLQYHLDHVGEASEIGLTEAGNNFAIMKLRQTDAKLWGFEGVPIEPDGTLNYDYNAHQLPGWSLYPPEQARVLPTNLLQNLTLEEFNLAVFG